MLKLTQEQQGRVAMVAAMLISGTIGLFVVSSGQSPFNVVFLRCVIGGAGMLLVCGLKGYLRGLRFTRRQLLFILLGAVCLVFNWVFLFSAYRLTSIGIATIIYHLQPFFLLFSGVLFLGDKLKRSNVLWLLLAFAGLLLIVRPNHNGFDQQFLLGCLSAVAAAVLYAATTLLTKQIANEVRPEVIVSGHLLVGAGLFVFLADFSSLPATASSWTAMLMLGLFHTTLMLMLLYTAFKKASTASLAIFGFLYPLVALIVDYLAFGRVIDLWQGLGGVLIVAAGLAYNAGVKVAWLDKKAG
jgi:drug/metabolite transporter (DMT)-like permease